MRKICAILFFILSASIFAAAQPGGGSGGGPNDDPDAPIDGAIGLLIAGGAYLGIRKLRQSPKKK